MRRVRIAIGRPDNDFPEVCLVAPLRRATSLSPSLAIVRAQGQEERHRFGDVILRPMAFSKFAASAGAQFPRAAASCLRKYFIDGMAHQRRFGFRFASVSNRNHVRPSGASQRTACAEHKREDANI